MTRLCGDILAVNQHTDTCLDINNVLHDLRDTLPICMLDGMAHCRGCPHALACSGGCCLVRQDARGLLGGHHCSGRHGVVQPLGRGWCLYEWNHAYALHGIEALLFVGMSNDGRQRIIEEIDVEKADCLGPKDRAMILAEILENHGSYEAFNRR
jgi:hypothetical protein